MSNSKTRRLAVAAVIAAAALTMTACSGSPSSQSTAANGELSGALKIDFGAGSQQAPMDALIKAFEQEHPKVKINVTYLPANSITQTILTQLRGGNGPDVFYSNGGSGQTTSVQPLAKAGQLASFDSAWTKDIPKAAESLYLYKDKVYGLPLAQVAVGIVYNSTVFDSLGIQVPKTVDDLLDACSVAKKDGKSIMTVAAAAGQNPGVLGQSIAASYVYSKIPDWNAQRAADKTTFAKTPEWKQALQVVTKMNDAGCFVPGVAGTQTNQAFSQVAETSALTMPGPAGVINAVKAISDKDTLGIFPFPGTSSANTRALVGYTDALVVNAKSKNLAAAKAFVDYVGEPANAKIYTDAVSAISLQDSAKGVVPEDLSNFGPYLKDQKTVSTPNLEWPNGDVYNAFMTGIQGLLTGQQTPEQVLESMDAAWK
ncbi:ABC transporter substrate-binding protein [Leifsonia sp. NPDC058194]|uniref:ABC transporter substrate-binding protein n=1 Tax=Leifsonia sp. NPDC058194 TaxID=3346374 RepID=UPI0036DD7FE2